MNFLVITAIALFAVSCGGGSNTPAGIEKAVYSQLKSGNYEKAVEILFDNLDGTDEATKDKAQSVAAFAEKVKESSEEHGGIKDFEILEEKISDDGETATVKTKVIFGNGSENTETNEYVKKDGKWKLSIGK
jgi:predicted metal-dependent phosphoesterase TrpH